MTTTIRILLALLVATIVSVNSFGTPLAILTRSSPTTRLHGFPRAIHTEFTVERATPEIMDDLGVSRWPTWGTEGSDRYKTGIKSPLKYYDVNELSYIIKGKME
jgi:hypothetical protein